MVVNRARTDLEATRVGSRAALGQRVLAHSQSSRDLVQDFVPLAESLEWELGQQYLRERGNKAFISDASPVPFVINNDGTLSRNAAEVFFASLLEAEKAGTLEPDIFVLELGIGVGLFARFFLDPFESSATSTARTFTTGSRTSPPIVLRRMLMDVIAARRPLAASRPLRRATQSMRWTRSNWLPGDVLSRERSGPVLRAVFLNYLLDCLPAAVLEL